jgi:long-chain fatty acid transport protein
MQIKKLTFLIALAGLTSTAYATDGYFSHGYGMKAIGMGGAATAMADDTFGGANNPASMAFVGNRLDLGANLFSPRRAASRTGSDGTPGTSNTPYDFSVSSDSKYFVIPELGYNHMMSSDLSLGVSVYGNGGMNSDYAGDQIPAGACSSFGNTGAGNMLCGSGRLGVDLMQLIIAPTVAYKIAPNHSIGISPLIGYQRFKADGIQPFGGFSTSPTNVSNKGYDDAFGYGVRIGYMGKITPSFTIGAAYAPKMSFQKFKKYSGLFAEGGNFDIPENYNLGLAWQAVPSVTLALDYQRINYGGVKSISDPSSNLLACMGGDSNSCLGGSNGAGFGWKDVNVWKLGAEYQYNKQWAFRAGYNHTDNPISASDVTFNILAPGVVKDHMTLGFTHTFASGDELTMAYMHAFENSVTGNSFLQAFGFPASTQEKIKMYEDSLGVAYSWKM